MTTATRNTKAGQIERTLCVAFNAEANAVEATVCETHHKKTKSRMEGFNSYFIRKIAADFGQGYEVEKRFADSEVYHVHHGHHGMTCDCPGGTYKGNCRHEAMVKEAIAKGLL